MAALRKLGRRMVPFRLPFFRIFYSVTYTIIYLLLLVILAITPISLIYSAFKVQAWQYIFMIGGTYLLTFIFALIIYSSRIYTTRSTLAAVGKAYVPIEEGEVSKKVRKMIVKELEKSAVVAWESRPRDVEGEILAAEHDGIWPVDDPVFNHSSQQIGEYIVVNPSDPPWGDVQHVGWSSPSSRQSNKNPHVQFAKVVAEMPHLIEARAVSLAPPAPYDNSSTPDQVLEADPLVVNVLRRPRNAALREYLLQLSCLGLVQPLHIGDAFLARYERARFSGKPMPSRDFDQLMQTFARLLSGMAALSPEILHEIRKQSTASPLVETIPLADDESIHELGPHLLNVPREILRTPVSSIITPVTAPESRARTTTIYLTDSSISQETLGSVVIQRSPTALRERLPAATGSPAARRGPASSSWSLPSDTGSVLHHAMSDSEG
jgi:hypothetical protein